MAPLTLFILLNLLILLVGHFLTFPGWLLTVSTLALAWAVGKLTRKQRRREKEARAGLGHELDEMQDEVERAARRYHSLLEGAGNAIFVFHADTGALEEMNRKGAELFACSKGELTALKMTDLVPPEEYDKFRAFVIRLRRRGRADAVGLTLRRKDGTTFHAEIDARVIPLNNERVALCIMRDISDKLAAEREIRQRNRELSLLNTILTGMHGGEELSAVVERTLREVMELLGAIGGIVRRCEGENRQFGETTSLGVDDKLVRLLGEAIPADGRIPLEVTQRERAALPNEVRWAGFDSLTEVPLLAGKVRIGLMQLVHETEPNLSDEELRFLSAVGRQMGSGLEKARLFDELNWKSTELLRSHRLLEKTSHNLSLSESKLRENLAVVEKANMELSRLDRMKNQFLGMVSHEFNTPLTSILSGAEHLLAVEKGENRAVLEMVRDGGLRLKELVADLLKLIKLEARGGELNKTPMHLQVLIELLREQFQPLLAGRQQRLQIKELDQLPFFDGDVEYLERVFSELLLNAIKFTPEGGEIEVSGRVLDREDLVRRRDRLEQFNPGFVRRAGGRCFMEVAVKDNGVGIPPEELRRIFEIFYEVGDIRHHSSGWGNLPGKGAGLGLAIVKGMVEAHGGMVWADSDRGSSFYLILPLEQETHQPELF